MVSQIDRPMRAAIRASVSFVALVVASTSAWAQCTSTGTATNALPFGVGSTVASVVSTMNAVTSGSLAQSTAFASTPSNPTVNQQGGGVWARALGGNLKTEADVRTSGTGQYDISGPILSGLVIGGQTVPTGSFSGTTNCHSTLDQEFVGMQLGADIGRFNFGGGTNFQWGITAGYTDITSKDKTPGQGSFSAETQVPFAGIYAALSSGPWSIDAQVRGDFVNSDLTDAREGLKDQPMTARSIAFLWNVNYRIDLPDRWFVEPSIGGVASITEVDQVNSLGGFFSGDVTGSVPGALVVDDIHSVIGRASVRVGKTIVGSTMAWQPFATASVFHEFAGDINGRIGSIPGIGITDATTTVSRVGTFGHVGAGVAGLVLNSGWLGYARADYRFGDNLESFTVNAGLRYQYEPNAMPDGGSTYRGGTYNWTGLYAGAFSGGLWGDQTQFEFTGSMQETHPKLQGHLSGGQVGFNYQVDRVVLGIEADYGLSNARGGKQCPSVASFYTCVGEINSLALFTGRIGIAHERALYYVKGGLALGEVVSGYEQNGGGFIFSNPPTDKRTNDQSGWAAGLGIEYALTNNWSVKGEWLHFDLGSETFNNDCFTTFGGRCERKSDTQGDIARVGVNYHFGHRGRDYSGDALK